MKSKHEKHHTRIDNAIGVKNIVDAPCKNTLQHSVLEFYQTFINVNSRGNTRKRTIHFS